MATCLGNRWNCRIYQDPDPLVRAKLVDANIQTEGAPGGSWRPDGLLGIRLRQQPGDSLQRRGELTGYVVGVSPTH